MRAVASCTRTDGGCPKYGARNSKTGRFSTRSVAGGGGGPAYSSEGGPAVGVVAMAAGAAAGAGAAVAGAGASAAAPGGTNMAHASSIASRATRR